MQIKVKTNIKLPETLKDLQTQTLQIKEGHNYDSHIYTECIGQKRDGREG